MIRQVELPSFRVTTQIGSRGMWSAIPGVGMAASINAVASMTWDATSGDLIYFDEEAFYRVR